jgi:hypothetical protein
MKARFALLLLMTSAVFPQDKIFDWTPANTEAARLDPGYYHAGRVYRPASGGGNMHIDVTAEKPVTVAMAPEAEWNAAVQNGDRIRSVNFLCMQEHIVNATYTCNLPGQHMVLVVRDERASADPAINAGVRAAARTGDYRLDRAVSIGLGTVLTGSGSVTHRFVSPNDIHIQYYSWLCVENCNQPEFRWFQKAKEKYELTPILKSYGGIFPDHEGETISVKIKAPVPMAVAVLPTTLASELYQGAENFEAIVAKSNCQQRAVQKLEWECPLNLSDGPLAVVIAPESRANVPRKKVEVEIYETKCVANCGRPVDPDKSGE